MSALLKTQISCDLENCKNEKEVDNILEKYNKGFSNAVDASEFLKMVAQTKMQLLHS